MVSGVAGVVVLTALLCVACAATLDTSSTPIWSGMHGNSQRRNVLPWAGPSTALTLVSNITWTGPGKTHGAPAVDAKGRAYAVYWNQTNQGFPFLRRWDNPGGPVTHFVDTALPNTGPDVMQDSNDALLLGFAGATPVAFVTLSSYSNVASASSFLYCIELDSMTVMWSRPNITFIDGMVCTSNGSTLVTVSSQSREVSFLDPTTGDTLTVIDLYGTMDSRSSVALAPDQDTVYLFMQDSTFNHNQAVAMSIAQKNYLWVTVNASFTGSWPPPLSVVPTGWLPGAKGKAGPGLLCVGTNGVSATSSDGTVLWYSRFARMRPFGLGFVGDFAVSPLGFVFVLGSTPDNLGSYLLAVNASGGYVASQSLGPIRIAQFEGTLMVDPVDGATVYMSLYDTCADNKCPMRWSAWRLDYKAPVPVFNYTWSTSTFPGVDAFGYVAAGQQPGSMLLSNWDGMFYFAPPGAEWADEV